jgi:hypothetical protein
MQNVQKNNMLNLRACYWYNNEHCHVALLGKMLKNHAKIHHEKLFKEYWELEWEFMNFQG